MATITPTIANVIPGIQSVTWAAMTDADTATAYQIIGFSRGFVEFDGTFGGGTVVLQGSTDNTNWATLRSISGAAVSATAADAFDFVGNALYIRPAVTGGTAESLNARVILRG